MQYKKLMLGVLVLLFTLSLATIALYLRIRQNTPIPTPQPTKMPIVNDLGIPRGDLIDIKDDKLAIKVENQVLEYMIDPTVTLFSCAPSQIPISGGGFADLKTSFIDLNQVDINKNPRIFSVEEFISPQQIAQKVNTNTLILFIEDIYANGPYRQKFIFTDCK